MMKAALLIAMVCLSLLLPGMALAQPAQGTAPAPDTTSTLQPAPVSAPSQPNASGPTTAAPAVLPAALPSVSTVTEEQGTPKSPAPTLQELESGVKINNSERISLDLKGIDIVELFRILSMKMGITIVPSKSVTGRVNIYLNNLTFEDALDVILLSQDLACDRNESIINIMTSAEYEKLYGRKYNEKRQYKSLRLLYAKPANVFNAISQIKSDIGKIIVDESSGTILLIDIPEKLELMAKTIVELDKPPQTEIFDLKYAKPADVKAQLTNAITAGAGEVYVDERSNKVIVSDLPEKMKKIKRMVKALDETTRQVFIEAEILQITLKDEYQRGINWEKIIKQMDGLDLKGTFPVAPSFSPSPALTASSLKMVIGSLTGDNYTTAIQWLQTLGDTKILSRPRIAVLDGQEAKILVGSREAYVTQTLSQAQTTTVTSENIQFIDVGVKLDVVPTINKDGFVMMKIKPEVSSVRETLTTALGSIIPIVETSEAETSVKVKDGTMIMIAGLMKEDKRKDSSGMPLLSKIPILGSVLKSSDSQKETSEVIVFLTPHIISGETTVAGTEYEKMIPPDIVSKDIEENIISKKVHEIKPAEGSKLSAREQSEQKYAPAAGENDTVDLKDKMKGIKEY
jgi:type II secretory pathway component GspD/PulD (secretin)